MFASPLYEQHRQADLPWHSADDLRRILRIDGELRDVLQRRMKADWDEVRTVATENGITTIAPHFMAEGLIEAMEEMPDVLPEPDRVLARGRYRNAVTSAMKLMVAHLCPLERLHFALAASDR